MRNFLFGERSENNNIFIRFQSGCIDIELVGVLTTIDFFQIYCYKHFFNMLFLRYFFCVGRLDCHFLCGCCFILLISMIVKFNNKL